MTTTLRERGWWYPYIFVGLLVVVAVVNGIFAYFASSTFTGLSTEHAYEKGVTYNATLALARQQTELGWQAQAHMVPGPAHTANLNLTYSDKLGKPITGLDVQALATRPTVTGFDLPVHFQPAGDGVYVAAMDMPLGGEWDFDIVATGDGAVHQFQRRFVIP